MRLLALHDPPTLPAASSSPVQVKEARPRFLHIHADSEAARVLRAVRSVLPWWGLMVVLALSWGVARLSLPNPPNISTFYERTVFGTLAYHDAFSNIRLAEEGYRDVGMREYQTSVRFPVHPMLTRFVSRFTGWDTATSAFVVSKAALLGGLVGLWLLVAQLHSEAWASRAIPYMLLPLLGSGYTWYLSFPEPVHLLTWTLGLYWLLRDEILPCTLITIVGVWTRPHAVLILPVFALVLLVKWRNGEYRGLFDGRLWRHGVLVGGIPLLAFSAWMLHMTHITGIAYAPIVGQDQFGRVRSTPWAVLGDRVYRMSLQPDPGLQLGYVLEIGQVSMALFAVILLLWLAHKRRAHPALFMLTLLFILPGMSTGLFAIGRYALLTWTPLLWLYLVPRRFDALLWMLGLGFSYVLFILLTLAPAMRFVP